MCVQDFFELLLAFFKLCSLHCKCANLPLGADIEDWDSDKESDSNYYADFSAAGKLNVGNGPIPEIKSIPPVKHKEKCEQEKTSSQILLLILYLLGERFQLIIDAAEFGSQFSCSPIHVFQRIHGVDPVTFAFVPMTRHGLGVQWSSRRAFLSAL